MSLYQKDEFDIVRKRQVIDKIYHIEIDQHSISIKSTGHGSYILIDKEDFDKIIEKWNCFHGRK